MLDIQALLTYYRNCHALVAVATTGAYDTIPNAKLIGTSHERAHNTPLLSVSPYNSPPQLSACRYTSSYVLTKCTSSPSRISANNSS